MKISNYHFLKVFYFSVLFVWFIATIHIFYLYVDKVSQKKPVKGGTFVQAVFENINYLPYVSDNEKDDLYISFLFKGCLTSYISGEQILFKQDACDVKTNNYKTFIVSPLENATWSDGSKLTSQDIYFTYNDIIKENIWNKQFLSNYKNISISLNNDKVIIDFPKASIDNQIFLTNYILPSVLKGKTFEDYIDLYSKNPIWGNCGKLQDTKDPNSVVFDLSSCDNFKIGYYQLKKFDNIENFQEYIKKSSKNIIDMYINKNINGFKQQKILLNKFLIVFFNMQSEKLNINLRKQIATLLKQLYTGNYEEYFVKDYFLFESIPNITISKTEFENALRPHTLVSTGNTSFTNIYDLTGPIDTTQNKEYFLKEFSGAYTLKLIFDKGFDKVAVNGYVLKSYKSGEKEAIYKLSELFKNIKQGENVYNIVGYIQNKQQTIQNLKIHYKTKPLQNIDLQPQNSMSGFDLNQKDIKKITVLYYNNDITKYIADRFKDIIASNGLEEFFEFVEYDIFQQFQEKLQSKDYDIVIAGLDTFIKKDISDMFILDNATPSNYKNADLGSLVNQYFVSDEDLKPKIFNEINKIYEQNIPFVFVGKPVQNINIRNDFNFNIPMKLYGYSMIKQFLPSVTILYKSDINRKNLSIKGFIDFLKENSLNH